MLEPELQAVPVLLGIAAVVIGTLCVPLVERWPERLRSAQKRKFMALSVALSTSAGLWWHEPHGDGWARIYAVALTICQVVAFVLESEFGWFKDR